MKLPANKWCPGSGTATRQSRGEYPLGHCGECGYTFRTESGVVPKHRPKFSQKKRKEA